MRSLDSPTYACCGGAVHVGHTERCNDNAPGLVAIEKGIGLTMREKPKKLVYVAGSMRNRNGILKLSKALRERGFDVFNEWISPGEETDDKWREWAQAQGMTYLEALYSAHARNVFDFDKRYLDLADAFVLAYPAGKSAHAELGYMRGQGKPTLVCMEEEPDRWDVMLLFADKVVMGIPALLVELDRKVGG